MKSSSHWNPLGIVAASVESLSYENAAALASVFIPEESHFPPDLGLYCPFHACRLVLRVRVNMLRGYLSTVCRSISTGANFWRGSWHHILNSPQSCTTVARENPLLSTSGQTTESSSLHLGIEVHSVCFQRKRKDFGVC